MFSPVFALVNRRGEFISSAKFFASVSFILRSRSILFPHTMKGISPQTFKASSRHSFRLGRLSGLVTSKTSRTPFAPL